MFQHRFPLPEKSRLEETRPLSLGPLSRALQPRIIDGDGASSKVTSDQELSTHTSFWVSLFLFCWNVESDRLLAAILKLSHRRT